MQKNLGITFIEVLVTISLASVIAAMGFSTFYQWRNSVSLINQVDELKSKITEIRQLAISAAEEKNWGIHFEAEQYIIFSGDSYDQSDLNNKIIVLKSASIANPETTLSNGNESFGPDLIFSKFTGQTLNIGTITFVSTNNQDISRSFSIDNLGKIN